jgi:hypothetical protein
MLYLRVDPQVTFRSDNPSLNLCRVNGCPDMRDKGKNGGIKPFVRRIRQSVGILHESLPLP